MSAEQARGRAALGTRSGVPTRQSKAIGYLAAVVSTALMASVGLFVRHIPVGGQTIAFVRLGLGAVFLAVYLGVTGQLGGVLRVRPSPCLAASGAFLGLTCLSYIRAIQSTSLATAAFLLYLAPLVAVGLAALWLKERLSLGNLALVGLAFLGCLCLLELDVSVSLAGAGGWWGPLSALLYALFIVFNRSVPTGVPSPARALHQLFFGAIALLPFADLTSLGALSPSSLGWLAGTGLLPGFLALTLAITAIRHLKAHEFGTISYLEPLLATLIGLLVFGETLSALQAFGCALILAVGVAQLAESSSRVRARGDRASPSLPELPPTATTASRYPLLEWAASAVEKR